MNIKLNIKLPQSWNELSEKQLSEIAHGFEFFRKTEKSALTNSKLYVHLIKNLLRGQNWIKIWIALKQIPPKEYVAHLQFLLDGNTRTAFPAAFSIKNRTYHPPATRLQNLTMEEFSFADALYYHWRKSNDLRYLDLLCATLYRPIKPGHHRDGNDLRRKFNKIQIDKAVPLFKKIKQKKKLAIAYAYEGSRSDIISKYPTVFPKNEETEEERKNKPEAKYTPFGQLIHYKIQFDTGKLAETENLNIHKFLSLYENELKEMKKQKMYGSHA